MGKLPAPALHPDQGRNSRPQTPPGKTPGPSEPRGKKGTATFAAEVTGGSSVELLGVCLHMSFGTHTPLLAACLGWGRSVLMFRVKQGLPRQR